MPQSFARRAKILRMETLRPFMSCSIRKLLGTLRVMVHCRATGLEAMGDFFRRTMEASEGTFSMDVHNVLADGDVVVVLVTVNAQRKGISASFPEVHVWRMKNGKATEFREYQGDEQREDRFWS
jgi:ketosteroid isomerase-like protein